MKLKPKKRSSPKKSSEKKPDPYRLSFDDNPLPMWFFDPETLKFSDINKAAVKKYGYSRAEFMNMTIADIRPAEDVERLKETTKTLQGIQDTGEWRHRLKDGTIIHVEITSDTLLIGEKKTVLVVAHDVTERKSIEDQLRESLNRFNQTLDNMLEGCQVIGFDWRYLYVNHSVARQGRRTREELLGRTMMEAYPGIDQTELFSVLKDCMENRVPRKMENKFENPDGATGWFQLSIQPVPEGIFILSIEITERVRAEETIKKQLSRVQSLREIDLAILYSHNLQKTLETALIQVTSQLRVDAVDVLLVDSASSTLKYGAGRGFRSKAIEKSELKRGEGHAGRAALEKCVVRIPNLKDSNDFLRKALLEGEDFVSYLVTPLIVKGQVRCVLELYHRDKFQPDADWLQFLDALAGQIAIAVDSAALLDDLQTSNTELTSAYETTLEGWSAALDLRDKETEGHTQRVTTLTLELAKALGIPPTDLVNVRRGTLLHDIGKMGVADQILSKPDKLSDEEWTLMRMHPVYAYDMLSNINYLHGALDIPYCHHEKWDGTGYPRGLKGTDIPFAARIFSVVDVYDALTSDRPYRKAWSREQTLDYIREQSGSYFDPQVVEAFMNMVETGK
jgi:PAS domain S-box-containing protein/putative nucleotidyltransferase with HDIG domain